MYKIVRRKQLNDQVVLMEIDAPYIAAKAEAGQFIIYRIDERERESHLRSQIMTEKRELLRLFFRLSEVRLSSLLL